MKKLLWLYFLLILPFTSFAEEYINGVSSTEIIKQQVVQITVLSQQVAAVENQIVIVTNTITQPSTNFTSTATPYIITQTGSSNDISTNYNYQYFAPTTTAGIYMPVGSTSVMYNIMIDVNPGTNSFTIGTNNVLITTNDVLGVGASLINIRTNMTTTLLFNKAFNMVNWRLIGGYIVCQLPRH